MGPGQPGRQAGFRDSRRCLCPRVLPSRSEISAPGGERPSASRQRACCGTSDPTGQGSAIPLFPDVALHAALRCIGTTQVSCPTAVIRCPACGVLGPVAVPNGEADPCRAGTGHASARLRARKAANGTAQSRGDARRGTTGNTSPSAPADVPVLCTGLGAPPPWPRYPALYAAPIRNSSVVSISVVKSTGSSAVTRARSSR